MNRDHVTSESSFQLTNLLIGGDHVKVRVHIPDTDL